MEAACAALRRVGHPLDGGKTLCLPEGALPPKPTGVYAAVGMTRLNAGYGDVAFEKVMAQ